MSQEDWEKFVENYAGYDHEAPANFQMPSNNFDGVDPDEREVYNEHRHDEYVDYYDSDINDRECG